MGALNPLFLLAGLSIAVPIYLHLFHRHQARRLSFPALRYLERTEREHARQIRLRQILLMIARVVALALVVGAGARLFFGGRGAAHPPTAAVIIIDNSLSSGLVVGEVRVLDELKALALTALDEANDDDRFWILRAGEPWLPAVPAAPGDARRVIESIETSAARGDLTEALTRATQLLGTSELEHKEIHLLSDLQASAFSVEGSEWGDSIPVIVWEGHATGAANRALSEVVVGGGLPPLEGQRTEVTVAALEADDPADTAHVPLRLVVNERIRGAATIPAGAQTTIALPPTATGWVQGYVDADPDDLRADDRRYFAYRSRSAPTVAVAGDPGLFVREALAVLEDAGRVLRTSVPNAQIVIADGATSMAEAPSSAAVLVVPPSDATLLPALNRRLTETGVPWRVGPPAGAGAVALEGLRLPTPLQGVEARSPFELTIDGQPDAATRSLAEAGGAPWLVEGEDASGRRYLLLGSALDAQGTTLPVSTGMLRFIDWVANEWSGAGGGDGGWTAGTHLSAPAAASHVRFPGGAEVEIDGTRMVRGTGEAGHYTFTLGDSVVSVVAVNPPSAESALRPIDEGAYSTVFGPEVVTVERPAGWTRSIFQTRQGPELWWPFLLTVFGLMLLETMMATSGERSPLSRQGDELD